MNQAQDWNSLQDNPVNLLIESSLEETNAFYQESYLLTFAVSNFLDIMLLLDTKTIKLMFI